MLSKWLFVSFLTVGIQSIFANTHINDYSINNIDVTKFFSVFYNANTRMPLKGVLENVGRGPFPGIGFRGVKCTCQNFTCGCCNGVNITKFNIDHQVCTNFTYYPQDTSITFKFIVNEKELVTNSLSAKNPPPFCVPFYPPISFCVRFYDVYMSGRNLHACVDLETIVISWPILVLHFDCIKIGEDGISWIKPENENTIPQMGEMAVIMPDVNGPEIYDQVDFEPNFTESPNNNTSTTTYEEENNIGQLKL
ncbi:hypothetical protein PUN28_005989 [Cardiocondyla obscurior]|uniref:DUF4773 domain-containing protein n=2 Tax=Cardiocondyla obscurior TaxID=286306 RepID=A0AAW2G6G8_9HYME